MSQLNREVIIAAAGQRAALITRRYDKSAAELRKIQAIRSRAAVEEVLAVAYHYREGPPVSRGKCQFLHGHVSILDPAVGDQHAIRTLDSEPWVKVIGGGQRTDP